MLLRVIESRENRVVVRDSKLEELVNFPSYNNENLNTHQTKNDLFLLLIPPSLDGGINKI
jgi:hypothetical protein